MSRRSRFRTGAGADVSPPRLGKVGISGGGVYGACPKTLAAEITTATLADDVALATEIAGLRGAVVDLRGVVERNGERFEHFLATEGDIICDLKTRMTRVEQHLGLGK
ncbi:MAG: hypothetical protein IT384_04125 [Deltaproteobacteria bacterium]|nr:hypothetical protein [Deltaproteobacteria bacterium]